VGLQQRSESHRRFAMRLSTFLALAAATAASAAAVPPSHAAPVTPAAPATPAVPNPATAVDEYETPPDLAPETVLPPAMTAGVNFHVQNPVHSDGLMRRYVLDSRFGKFDAYGRVQLAVRIREVAALTALDKISPVDVVAGSIGNGVTSQVNTVTTVAKHPIDTVTGIPKGIAHLFGGFVAQGKEAASAAKSAVSGGSTDASGQSQSAVDKSTAAAKGFAEQYLGVTAADRRWYKKLRVDPYTNNQVLRHNVHSDAELDATTSFGMKFVVPGIAELGIAQHAVDAIYNEDPAVLRAHQRDKLASFGLTAQEVERYQNTLWLSPTRQTLLLEAALALDGVDGRGELFRHAMASTSDAEAQVYLQSVAVLLAAHRQEPVAALLPGVRLPAARLADGRIFLCAGFEAVYWTRDVAEGAQGVRQSWPADSLSAHRELWLGGTVSARARQELERRGWQIHENVVGLSAAAVQSDGPAAAP